MNKHYRCKYEYTNEFHPMHMWSVVGARMAVHVHITDLGESYATRYSGGVECHYRTPPDYMRDSAPSQDRCWLLHAPCWHDGSSLQAAEVWIPRWLRDPHNHDNMFRAIQLLIEEHEARDAGKEDA